MTTTPDLLPCRETKVDVKLLRLLHDKLHGTEADIAYGHLRHIIEAYEAIRTPPATEQKSAFRGNGQLGYGTYKANGVPIPDAGWFVHESGFLFANVHQGARLNSPAGCASPEEENARRLAACWNACRGISTEILESEGALPPPATGRDLQEENLLLRAQNDTLRKTYETICVNEDDYEYAEIVARDTLRENPPIPSTSKIGDRRVSDKAGI